MAKEVKLTPKQASFVRYYVQLKNATQAAIKAWYSKKTAKQIADENLSKPYLKDAIAKEQAKVNEKFELSQEWMINEWKKLVEYGNKWMEEGKPIDVTTVKDSLKEIGKLAGYYVEKKEVTGMDGMPIDINLTSLTDEELDKLLQSTS